MTLLQACACRLLRTAALLLIAVVLFAPFRARAQSVLISPPKRIDMVHDLARSILYVTNGNEVLRFSTATNSLLTPYSVNPGGQNLMGIDLSPDGNTLVVADATFGNGYNGVWVINI